MKFTFYWTITFIFFFVDIPHGSGAFDHGTATGQGKLEVDITWNPFDIIEDGQSYLMINYGILDKVDIHAYYADHDNYKNGIKSYYFGLFYQFSDESYLDLATAIGVRKMQDKSKYDLFFPQILYNIKMKNDYSIGGSIVKVIENSSTFLSNNLSNNWFTLDISLFIPITPFLPKFKSIEKIKLGIGLFNRGIGNKLTESKFLPAYSIDFLFH